MLLPFTVFLRRRACVRAVSALFAFALLVALTPSASARKFEAHKFDARKFDVKRHPRMRALAHAFVNAALPGVGLLPVDQETAALSGEKYELKLARGEGGEMIDVVYRVGDTYIPEALDRLNHFLRDSHNEIVTSVDPHTFDLLHTVLAKVGKPAGVIDILSGFRTQATNDALRASGTTNAAEHSQHIEAKAIDMRVPGVSANVVREAALSLQAGGVGYYPRAQFVHVDTGPVREWTYAGHAAKSAKHKRKHKRA